MDTRRVVAFDTETYAFAPGNMAPRIVCLSWASSSGSGLVAGYDLIRSWLHEHLSAARDGKELLVGHVVAYDSACICSTFPTLQDLVFEAYASDGIVCTSVLERLLDIAEGEFRGRWNGQKLEPYHYSLADIARRRLGRVVEKGPDTWRVRYAELENQELASWPAEAVAYSITDGEVTLAIYREQLARGERLRYVIPTQYHDSRADFALRLMSVWGVRTDAMRVTRLWDATLDRMEELLVPLRESGLVVGAPGQLVLGARRVPPVAHKSMGALRKAVADHYPGGSPPLTATKAIRTDAETLAACDYAPFEGLLEYDSLVKVAGTYIEKLVAPQIHAHFEAVGAASDRTTCSHPNWQNQPRMPGIRECVVPRSGYVFLACDYDTQEMRTLAQSCLSLVRTSKLAERFQQDRQFDPHLEFAAQLARISVEVAKQLKKAGDPHILGLRQQSKAANFGYPGGMGAARFIDYARGYGLKLSKTAATQLRDSWFKQWPEMSAYFEVVQEVVGPGGVGKQRIPASGFQRGGCGYSDTANGYFQTLAAHASKAAAWEVCRRCYTRLDSFLYGSRPVLFIHDEIVLETPEFVGHEAAQELEEVMVAAMEQWTPQVPAAASAVLMRRWSKKAKAVVKEGRLIPWEE